MALDKLALENNIKKSANTAAEKAFIAAMNVKITDPSLLSKLANGDYSEYAILLIKEQAKMFAKVFSETLSPMLSNDIDVFIKSGDVDIKLGSLFTGVVPVINDGGAAVLAQIIAKAKTYDELINNGKIK